MPLPSDAETRSPARERRRSWIVGSLLLAVAAALTLLAVRYNIRFSGLGALLVTFYGLAWLSIRLLRGRWVRFDRL